MKEFLSSVLREARSATEMTLRVLAEKVGCAPSLLSEIENGLRPAPKDEKLLEKMAIALNLDVNRVINAARYDRERRDTKMIRDLLSQDDELAACYCRAKEEYSMEELRNLFMEVFNRKKGV